MAVSRIIVDNNLKSIGKTTSNLEDISHNVGIYKWTNKTNNKNYIGLAVDLQRRKKEFCYFTGYIYTSKNSRIDNARRKYNNIEFWDYEILEYCTKRNLASNEIKYIKLYNSTNKKIGYNITEGGDGVSGYKMSEEQKQLISNKQKEYYKTHNNPMLGKHHTEEARRKIAEKRIGTKQSEEQKNKIRKPIYQIDIETNEIIKDWDSPKTAEIYYRGKKTGAIYNVCNGRRKTAFGYKWRYK